MWEKTKRNLGEFSSNLCKGLLLNDAMKPQQSFATEMKTHLVRWLSRFDCCDVPTPSNILSLLDQLSQYEFLTDGTNCHDAPRNPS